MLRSTAIMFLAFAMSSTALAQSPSAPAPEVMILGSFHFTGGGSDMINAEVDDFLTPARQAEIAAVLDRLEAFAPTKILVELTPDGEVEFNARYQSYRTGEAALGVNERQQIGMALAARLGHERLYAVDFATNMDFDAMFSTAESAGQTALIAEFQAFIEPIREEEASPERAALPVLNRMIRVNGGEFGEYHDLYLLLAQMGSAENPAGAEQMQLWWGRNLHIFSNIARLSEPGDRVLVIYGAGHKYLLERFIDSAPNLDQVDPLDYLQ